MDMSATAKQLSALRTCLADIARSGGNPNHAADGKFASGSGKSVPDIRVEPGETGGKYARLIARAEGYESIHVQCTHCSRMKNGPLSGRILGVVVRKDGWSHGICAPCEHAWLQQYFQSKGMSQEMAERRIALFMTNQPIPDDLLLPGETPSAEQRAQRLRVLAAHVTQVAEQVRRAGHPLRDGRGRWIGWVGGDGTVHMNGEGHAHTGWEGVTHHSAKAGKSGGGKSGGTKARGEDIHATAHRLQQEQGLPAEVRRIVDTTDKMGVHDNLVPVKTGINMDFDPFAKSANVAQLKEQYGEYQLGAALTRYTPEKLRATAEGLGLPRTGSKDELVSRITAHATEGRYSADFHSTKALGEATSNAADHPFAAEYRARLA